MKTALFAALVFTIALVQERGFAADVPLSGKERQTIIVTGASGYLGNEAAKLLAPDYNLILTGRDLSKLQSLQKQLKSSGNHCEIVQLDFVNSRSIDDFKEHLSKKNSPISGLVLIAPRPQFYGKELLQDEEIWLEVFRQTFTGPAEALKAVLPHLVDGGKIVVIAGASSVQLHPDAGPSCVIRRMWTSYTKALSHSLSRGISINALSPGVVLTFYHQERIQKQSQERGLSYEEQMRQEVAAIPLHRHAQPKEVAQSIRFLLSKESDFINGTNLVLDGGLSSSY